ncbi:hypothetical protein [Paenibacillus humicola]|uniref:hypothetical protein n=1 Tax=Paenibacillus humicola TaxID=3110540 RepID=UPI00237AF705|nr:hypothetical protein [Paenibacillus humicola]
MLNYRFDPDAVDIRETPYDDGVEYTIRLLRETPYGDRLNRVKETFEHNDDFTDVLFYAYPNLVYKVIVKPEHVADFIAELFKRRFLRSVEWTEEPG